MCLKLEILSILSKAFGHVSTLNTHIASVHRKEKRFKCDVCSKVGINLNDVHDCRVKYYFSFSLIVERRIYWPIQRFTNAAAANRNR